MTMLQISNYINNNLLFNVIYIASSILLMIFSPIDSANKRLDNDDKRFCKNNDFNSSGFVYYCGIAMDSGI